MLRDLPVPDGHNTQPIPEPSVIRAPRPLEREERRAVFRKAAAFPTLTVKNGPHAGDVLTLQPLGPAFIDRMVALQKTDTTGNTIFRDAHFIDAMMKRGDKAFGFVAKDGALVAQAIVRSNMELLPETLRSKFTNAADRHAYIGSIVVDPEYKKNGLMGNLVQQCLKEASTKDNTDVHARVVVGNDPCLRRFIEKFKFATVMTGQSPDATEPREVTFLHRKL